VHHHIDGSLRIAAHPRVVAWVQPLQEVALRLVPIATKP
jgi:hypothetical protein